MKRKFWNWVRNEGEKRVLLLDGEISDETWWGDEVTPVIFRSELNAAEGDIDLWINSPGGDCYAAAQIYNMLMEYKGNVAVKIDGIAASAASVVAMAGTTVEMSSLGMLMIHNPMFLSAICRRWNALSHCLPRSRRASSTPTRSRQDFPVRRFHG